MRYKQGNMPLRISVVTYNLWRIVRWPQRADALTGFLAAVQPDILCVQELQRETRKFLDNQLSDYGRIRDELPGWEREGNIYWNQDMFSLIEFGTEDIGQVEEMRRLFWVRLWTRGEGRSLLVATVHLTFKATHRELTTGMSPRLAETHAIVKALSGLVTSGDPVILTGDFNDASHPTFILNDAGYIDCFTALGLVSPPTSPTYQTSNIPRGRPAPSQTLDWIVSKDTRVVAAQVPNYTKEGIAPSDHLPVLAVFEI